MAQNQNRSFEFRSPQAPARKAVISIWAFIAVLPFSMLVDVVDYLESALECDEPGSLLGVDVDVLNNAALIVLVTFLVSAFFVLRWTYRVNQNACALAADKPISPGWAVGWHFVPIANYWKPLEAIGESWQIATDPKNWQCVAVPGLLRTWWALWIIGRILDNGARTAVSVESLDRVMAGDVLNFAGSVASLVSALLLIRIIRELTRRQMVTMTSATGFG